MNIEIQSTLKSYNEKMEYHKNMYELYKTKYEQELKNIEESKKNDGNNNTNYDRDELSRKLNDVFHEYKSCVEKSTIAKITTYLNKIRETEDGCIYTKPTHMYYDVIYTEMMLSPPHTTTTYMTDKKGMGIIIKQNRKPYDNHIVIFDIERNGDTLNIRYYKASKNDVEYLEFTYGCKSVKCNRHFKFVCTEEPEMVSTYGIDKNKDVLMVDRYDDVWNNIRFGINGIYQVDFPLYRIKEICGVPAIRDNIRRVMHGEHKDLLDKEFEKRDTKRVYFK